MEDSASVELAMRLGAVLHVSGRRITAAESCTGGGIAWTLTSVPGSSEWFWGGFVPYTEAAKRRWLGVPAAVLARDGAVSEPTARAMAEGALRAGEADIALAVTGIAGPGGGEVLQPVGTVWFAWAARDAHTAAAVHTLEGDRAAVRAAAIRVALEGALAWLERTP